ncbi:putative tricarboxylic transport membrane protein [alpha proteobacterium BAL199]|jgi:putative tricarboxylic transport membrane protein|nr:putative tricarboxylic transport membrane protein [alpha proteobacterium BAL199]
MTSDRVLGAVCLVLGLAFMFGASRIQTGFILDPLGPKTFPMIIGGILVVSSIVPLVKPDPAPGWPSAQAMMEIALALAVFVGYAVVLPELGFVPATALAAAALSWRLGNTPLKSILCGVGIAVGIYVVFHLILGLSLAKGPLGI